MTKDRDARSKRVRSQILEVMLIAGIIFLMMEAVLSPRILFNDWQGFLAAVCAFMPIVTFRSAHIASVQQQQAAGFRRMHGGVPSIFLTMNLLSLAWMYSMVQQEMPDLFSNPIQALFVLAAIGICFSATHFYGFTMYFYVANRKKAH